MLDTNERIRRTAGRTLIGVLGAAALAAGGIGFLSSGAASSAPACTGSGGGSAGGPSASVRGATAQPASAPAASDAAPTGIVTDLVREITAAIAPLAGTALAGGPPLPVGTVAPIVTGLTAQVDGVLAKAGSLGSLPALPVPSGGLPAPALPAASLPAVPAPSGAGLPATPPLNLPGLTVTISGQ
jgi:hypothetical protein